MDLFLSGFIGSIFLLAFNGPALAQQNIPVDINPQNLIIKDGEPLEFVCRVGRPILYCSIRLPTGRAVSLRPQSSANNAGLQYFGDGFQAGQCGVKIERSDASYNGVFMCNMEIDGTADLIEGRMQVTVARPPQQPELHLEHKPYSEDYNEGETLEASCTVRSGRPAANITWLIGNETIYSGLSLVAMQEDVNAGGVKSDQATFSVQQNITRVLGWHDHGKKLRCVAQHIALDTDLQSEADIRIRFPPKGGSGSEIRKYNFIEGNEGVITHEIAANPQPRIHWKINEDSLIEGERNAMYEAEQARQIDGGKWEARLRINNVRASDMDLKFILTADNGLGTATYTIRISTDEPKAETDLSTVGIVAIVIAVLVLFIVILLVCFARVTGRWCFAAGVPIRSDKESPSPTHEGGFHGFWSRLTPNYRSVSTIEELPPVPISLPPESQPLNLSLAQADSTPINTAQPPRETNLDTLHEERGGALHSSDTESADRAPAASAKDGERKSLFKLPAFLSKNKTSVKVPMDEVKTVTVDEPKQKMNAGVGGDGVVYAELDLANARKDKPTIRREDDKTEYAEIIHSKPV